MNIDKVSDKIDFTKKYADLYDIQEGVFSIVSVPKLHYIKATGVGFSTKQKSLFVEAKRFLSGLAFSIKFRLKRQGSHDFQDYLMPPIQVEWNDLEGDETTWKRDMYLLQPSSITESIVQKSLSIAKMKQQDIILPKVEYSVKKRGQSIQALHVGAYDTLDQTINFLKESAESEGYTLQKERTEIYLNDLRRTKSNKLETIIRYKIDKK